MFIIYATTKRFNSGFVNESICHVTRTQSLIGYFDKFVTPIGSCSHDAGVTWGSRDLAHKTVSLPVSVNRSWFNAKFWRRARTVFVKEQLICVYTRSVP